MQSFLQYRSFHTAIKAQLERDQERIEAAGHHDRPQQPSAPGTGGFSSPSNSDKSKVDEDTSDLEKGSSSSNGLGEQPRSTSTGDFQEAVEEKAQDEDKDEDDEEDDDDYELTNSRRTFSRTLSRTTTQSTGTRLGNVLTGVEVRKRTTHEGGDGNVFVVNYESEDDPLNPHNWTMTKRLRCTFTIAGIGFVVGFASAIDSAAIDRISKAFNVSPIVESLATGLFLIGFGLGALFAGPFSETFGRNPVYITTLLLYMIFIMASGLAPNIQSQLVFRFFAGIFGSTPLTCAGGSISDLWNPLERVWVFPIFANAAFTGPLCGPVIGGWIAQSSWASWRWVEWTTLLFSGTIFVLVILLQPETFPPILLKWKAEHLRKITGDERYRGSIEIREETLVGKLKRALYRPLMLTLREPIILLVALYLTVIYVILFGFLDGFEYIFGQTYGLSEGITGLCFLAIIVGLFGASALVPLIYKWAKRDLKKIQEQGGERLPPEFRLWFSMLGGTFAIPISLFWMAWTARPDISIWSPLGAAVLFGYGTLTIFITCYQYIIDSYEIYAASALASITLIRYIGSGVIVVVSIPWYENLGVAYTCTILGCLGAIMAPVPYVFYKYGPAIRSKSKYAVSSG